MKTMIILLSLTISQVFAGIPDMLEGINCHEKIEKKLKTYSTSFDWVRGVNPEKGILAMSTPTSTFGRWVEIIKRENPELIVYESEKTTLIRWKRGSCDQVLNSSFPPLEFLGKRKSGFTDKDLEKLVNSKKLSLVYIWAPEMVYSMKEMKTFIAASKKANLSFVPLLGNDSDVKYAKKALVKRKLKINVKMARSLELAMRSQIMHYPISFVVGNGRISERIFGVMPTEDLMRQLDDRVGKINLRREK